MYKVWLVDDEALIREAISENIKWNELGYELTATAENGKEAIERLAQELPDLILTDICMPYADGIALAKYVHENCPQVGVVIISGYDDFDYAKQALKYQVKEYILKPITSRELGEVLLRISAGLDKEREKDANLQKIQKAYNSNLPVMKERFWNQLISGQGMREDISEKLRGFDAMVSGKYFCALLVEGESRHSFLPSESPSDESLLRFAMYNIAKEIVEEEMFGIAFQNTEEKLILLLEGEQTGALERRAEALCIRIQESVKRFLGMGVSISIGKTVLGMEEISTSYDNAKAAAEYKFMTDGEQIIYGKDVCMKEKEASFDLHPFMGELVLAVKANQTEELERVIANIWAALRVAFLSRNRSLILIQKAVLTLMLILDEVEIADNNPCYQKEQEFLHLLFEKAYVSELELPFLELCKLVSDSISGERDSYCKKQAVQALAYIEKNIGDSEVSLQTVCTHLCMSSSYFSMIFKNYTGETFIECLTKKRMEKAKGLFQNTALKTYEIASEVGYADPHYFSSTFKKLFGITPTEYAKSVREKV